MAMGRRPDVPTSGPVGTVVTAAALGARMAVTIGLLPLRAPWRGPSSPPVNLAQESTREILKTFMRFAVGLPTPRLRSLELLLDDVCKALLVPIVERREMRVDEDVVGDVPGIWIRPIARTRGTVLYLHGGGYTATTPNMYLLFASQLAAVTACDVFLPDYRLAPEFPFPAGMHDAVQAYQGLLDRSLPADRIVIAGDSGGGGLTLSTLEEIRGVGLDRPAGCVLFSPEVSLTLDLPSVRENAPRDILPESIPVDGYLGDVDPYDPWVSPEFADLRAFPPVFVSSGGAEMFRDQIRGLVRRLHDDGVDTSAVEEDDMFHVFPILMPWSGAARRTLREVGSFTDTLLGARLRR